MTKTSEPKDFPQIKDAYTLYESGKKRRYDLLFAVNGGAFAISKLLTSSESKLLGDLTLAHLAIGMGIFTILMVWDIYAFGEKMRGYLKEEVFQIEGKAVLLLLGFLIVLGWYLVAPDSQITKSNQIIALLFPVGFWAAFRLFFRSPLTLSIHELKGAIAMTERDGSNDENLRMSYQTLCASYNAIDTFRGQLLGFLPLASSGIFVLLKEKPNILSHPKLSLLPIGLFGFFITLGLYIFEIYGTRRCTHLIILGQHLEKQLNIEGQFKHRPMGLQALPMKRRPRGLRPLPEVKPEQCSAEQTTTSKGKVLQVPQKYIIKRRRKSIFRDFLSLINEPMAAGVIYPAVGAGWLYLALQSIQDPLLALVLSSLVFCLGFLASCSYGLWLKRTDVPAKKAKIKANSSG